MQATDYIALALRWVHILAGILWIGLLYFYNFVNGPFTATMDAETKKKVIPELIPRSLYWFRWGAAYTWFAGIFLIYFVFESSNTFLANPSDSSAGSVFVLYSFLLAPFIYDFIAKSIKDPKVLAGVGFVLICGVMIVIETVCKFGYRGYMIYTGAMFGSIMAYNVWYRIWPAQQKIIAGVKSGVAADPALPALAGARSKHNTYLSVPLVWAMINSHTIALAGDMDWAYMAGVILIGWYCVMLLYKKAARVKGF